MFSIFLYGFKKVLEEADNDGKEFSVQMKMVADEKRNTRKEKKIKVAGMWAHISSKDVGHSLKKQIFSTGKSVLCLCYLFGGSFQQ